MFGENNVIFAQAVKCRSTAHEANGAMQTPIYQTNAFKFKNIDDASALYGGERDGFGYTRRGNPTIKVLEDKLAAIEKGEACLALASGMSAIGGTLLALVKNGDHVVTGNALYGGTDYTMRINLPDLGVETTFVDTTNLDEVRNAIRSNTKVIYFESPTNPTMSITDIKAISEIAKPLGIKVVIDNTFAPAPLQYPLNLGADFVIHSLSKYLSGHGDTVGGAVIGKKDDIERIRMHVLMRINGGAISPFNAFLILRGIKTLNLRIRQHCNSASKVAEYLDNHPYIDKVYHPSLKDHPQHVLAKKQMNGMYTGILAFEVKEGVKGKTALESGKILLNSLKIISLAVSLGEPDSLIQHPASMTHCNIPKDIRLASGISDGLVRLSVGLEHPDDLIMDLENAFECI
jgi:methionine-gamma-lyase